MCHHARSISDDEVGRSRDCERGVALVIAMMTMTLMLSLGSALILLSSSEVAIAANFRASHEALYAADAVVERTIADLKAAPDWTAVLNGTAQATFVDGVISSVASSVEAQERTSCEKVFGWR